MFAAPIAQILMHFNGTIIGVGVSWPCLPMAALCSRNGSQNRSCLSRFSSAISSLTLLIYALAGIL